MRFRTRALNAHEWVPGALRIVLGTHKKNVTKMLCAWKKPHGCSPDGAEYLSHIFRFIFKLSLLSLEPENVFILYIETWYLCPRCRDPTRAPNPDQVCLICHQKGDFFPSEECYQSPIYYNFAGISLHSYPSLTPGKVGVWY